MKEIFKDKLSDGRTVSLNHWQRDNSYQIEISLKPELISERVYRSDTHIFRGEGSKDKAWSFISNLFPGRVFTVGNDMYFKNEFGILTLDEL